MNAFLFGIVLCISVCCGVPLTKSNGDLDSVSVEQHILHLEETVADLQSQFKIQAQTQAAVLSSVLSKLASTTDELSKVNAKLDALEGQHSSTLAELARVNNELNGLSGVNTELENLRKDYDIILVELNATKKDLNATSEELCRSQTDFMALQTEINATQLDVNNGLAHLNATNGIVAANSDVMKMLEVNLTKITGAQNLVKIYVTKMKTDIQNVNQDISSFRAQFQNNSQAIQSLSSIITKMQIDVAYEVTLLSDTFNVSYNQVLKFPNVLYNRGDGYDVSSGIFTAPVSGTYMFWAHVMVKDNLRLYIKIYKSGQEIGSGYTPPEQGYGTASITTVTYLNKADTVWLIRTGGMDMSSALWGHNFSSYGGALIHAA